VYEADAVLLLLNNCAGVRAPPPRRPALAAAAASLTSTECRFSWTRLTGALPRPLQMGGPDAGFHIVRHEALIAAMVAHFKSLPPGHIVLQPPHQGRKLRQGTACPAPRAKTGHCCSVLRLPSPHPPSAT
jgi:hypothetical protein